jgi:hypothetical protein
MIPCEIPKDIDITKPLHIDIGIGKGYGRTLSNDVWIYKPDKNDKKFEIELREMLSVNIHNRCCFCSKKSICGIIIFKKTGYWVLSVCEEHFEKRFEI